MTAEARLRQPPVDRPRRSARRQAVGFCRCGEDRQEVLERFDAGEFDVCTLFYSEFQSVISQVPTAQQVIPANVAKRRRRETTPRRGLRIRAGRRGSILETFCRAMSVQIFPALLENAASEQGARMSAMDNATRNAGEMIDKLTMSYNRQRQAQITKELIEIISGAEAL
jgi:F-type H+-transporting ATPase subunit gamma